MSSVKIRRTAALLAIAGLTVAGVAACSDDDETRRRGDRDRDGDAQRWAGSRHRRLRHRSCCRPARDARPLARRACSPRRLRHAERLDGDADFDQLAGALEANTVDLGGAINSVYGGEAETTFLDIWRKHIGFFVDYTVATTGKDTAGQEAALEALDGYREGFSTFLAGANENIDPDAIAAGLQMHVDQLTAALTTYQSGDFADSYEQVRASYAHMFATGDVLAGAIVTQSPEEFGS